MLDEQDSKFNNGSQDDPYKLLGLQAGATFDEIQVAKAKKVTEAGSDLIKKAKVEAAYDSLLMVSLKERQLGKVSNAAANASEREKVSSNEIGGIGSTLLTRLKGGNFKNTDSGNGNLFPSLSIPSGQGLTLRLAIGALVFVLVLISPDQSLELILSFSTIALFMSQVKRGRKPLPSLGWSVVLLSIGLIIGALLAKETGLSPENLSLISSQKLESLPAVILLWLGAIFLD